jgi:hypothetical protein
MLKGEMPCPASHVGSGTRFHLSGRRVDLDMGGADTNLQPTPLNLYVSCSLRMEASCSQSNAISAELKWWSRFEAKVS